MDEINELTVLVNPAASNGEGHAVWLRLQPRFDELFAGKRVQVIETASRQQAVELGATLNTQLIISVSGDGGLLDIAQGLMSRPASGRPALSVIPVGSGNDLARSLHLPTNPFMTISRLARSKRKMIDVGQVNQRYFLNTLSFGVDAAVSDYTHELRQTTKRRGFLLYAQAAVTAIVKDLKPHQYHMVIDGKSFDRELLICAIQNGQYYGGGFHVAPTAQLDDGLLNICMATPVSVPKALVYMALLARGKHENRSAFSTCQANAVYLEVDPTALAQCDGEKIEGLPTSSGGRSFDVRLLPAALAVVAP